jgi:DNA-binding CsgD family transcriptional regulator
VPSRNPFKPTAGATPPLLVGRNDVLEEIEESFDDGPGAPARLVIFTGARGVGKTVMLSEVNDRALIRGWVALDDTALPGLTNRLLARASRALGELDGTTSPSRHVTGVTLPFGGGGVTVSDPQPERTDLREHLGALLDALERNGTGLLITIDEVHAADRTEMRELATAFQHLVREDRDVALVMAGLPSAISDLLGDDVLTFLRRATPFVLDDVPLDQVRHALRSTVETQGRRITDGALDEATEATGGYPFMIQLVGYHVWRKADGDVIELDAVRAGVPAARKRLGSTVHESAIADLSEVDRTYLLAMAQDEGRSSTSQVARRMHVSPHYASTYRGRLIAAGVIEPAGRGYVDFAIPYLREYLREHAARLEMASRHRKGR